MTRLTSVGCAAGLAVALACASLPGAATASRPSTSGARPAAAAVPTHDATPDATFSPAQRASSLETATINAASVAERLHLTRDQSLRVTDVERDADGTLHVRYSRTLGGLPVLGGDLVVHESSTGVVRGADFATSQPLVLATDARTRVAALEAAQISAHVGGATGKVATARKVVWAVEGVPRLAWLTKVTGKVAQGVADRRAVVVDASTGRTIQSWDLHQAAVGRGRSLYSGTVKVKTVRNKGAFLLKDNSRGGSKVVDVHDRFDRRRFLKGTVVKDQNNVWGNGEESSRQSAAIDATYGSAKTWDYYLEAFQRKGIRNNGRGATSRVHYAKDYDNAFWNDACFCMTYGDGGRSFTPLVSLDVAGHEMTHGVTSSTAGLYYFGDAGGLNEATSDIFGTIVEFSAHNAKNPGNYYIGEQIIKPGQGKFLRRMDNPRLDIVSFNCWGPNIGLSDPHFTSGPANHFFYLLAEGSGAKRIGGYQHNSPTCGDAPRVQGIGRGKAAQIWYRALTRYFVSTTGYVDARDATIRAAVDLFGKKSGACRQVVKAWNAVAVPSQYWTCAGKLHEGPNTFAPSPGFEGPNGSWSTTGKAVVTKNRRVGLPRSGRFYGNFLAGSAARRGSFMHRITVPTTATATLRFYMLISAGSRGTVDVRVDGNPISGGAGHFDRGSANDTFMRWDIPVSDWKGQTVPMSIVVDKRTGSYFRVLLDDFSLTPR